MIFLIQALPVLVQAIGMLAAVLAGQKIADIIEEELEKPSTFKNDIIDNTARLDWMEKVTIPMINNQIGVQDLLIESHNESILRLNSEMEVSNRTFEVYHSSTQDQINLIESDILSLNHYLRDANLTQEIKNAQFVDLIYLLNQNDINISDQQDLLIQNYERAIPNIQTNLQSVNDNLTIKIDEGSIYNATQFLRIDNINTDQEYRINILETQAQENPIMKEEDLRIILNQTVTQPLLEQVPIQTTELLKPLLDQVPVKTTEILKPQSQVQFDEQTKRLNDAFIAQTATLQEDAFKYSNESIERMNIIADGVDGVIEKVTPIEPTIEQRYDILNTRLAGLNDRLIETNSRIINNDIALTGNIDGNVTTINQNITNLKQDVDINRENERKQLDDLNQNINENLKIGGAVIGGMELIRQITTGTHIQTAPDALRTAAQSGACQALNGGCGTQVRQNELNNALNPINNNLNGVNALLNGADLANTTTRLTNLTNLFNNFKAKFDKLYENLGVDRALRALDTALLLHNAMMLSNNLFQTLGDTIDVSLQLLKVPFLDDQGNEIGFTQSVTNNIKNTIISIVGNESYLDTVKTWNSLNRIYQSGANLLYSVRSLFDESLDYSEMIGEMLGKFMNTARRDGLVSENSYPTQTERLPPKSKFRKNFDAFDENIEEAEEALDSIAMIVSSTLGIVSEMNELSENSVEFAKVLNDEEKVLDDIYKEDKKDSIVPDTNVIRDDYKPI
jgi:hypothetical protein